MIILFQVAKVGTFSDFGRYFSLVRVIFLKNVLGAMFQV